MSLEPLVFYVNGGTLTVTILTSVLQMMEMPIDSELHPDTVTLLIPSRDWEIQTILGVEVGQGRAPDEGFSTLR